MSKTKTKINREGIELYTKIQASPEYILGKEFTSMWHNDLNTLSQDGVLDSIFSNILDILYYEAKDLVLLVRFMDTVEEYRKANQNKSPEVQRLFENAQETLVDIVFDIEDTKHKDDQYHHLNGIIPYLNSESKKEYNEYTNSDQGSKNDENIADAEDILCPIIDAYDGTHGESKNIVGNLFTENSLHEIIDTHN